MNTFANRSLPVQLSLAKLFTFRWQFTYDGAFEKTRKGVFPLSLLLAADTLFNIFSVTKLLRLCLNMIICHGGHYLFQYFQRRKGSE